MQQNRIEVIVINKVSTRIDDDFKNIQRIVEIKTK
jgi:hypothetical protein